MSDKKSLQLKLLSVKITQQSRLSITTRIWCVGWRVACEQWLINAADQFPRGAEWLDGAEGRCVLWDGGV